MVNYFLFYMLFFLLLNLYSLKPMSLIFLLYLYSQTLNRYGNWGICFIYGTWFALGALAATKKTYNNSATIRRGVEFLLRTQGLDGGWGESYLSCPEKVTLYWSIFMIFRALECLVARREKRKECEMYYLGRSEI